MNKSTKKNMTDTKTMTINGEIWLATCSMCGKLHEDSQQHFGISDSTWKTNFEWVCDVCVKKTYGRNTYKFSQKYKNDKFYVKLHYLLTYRACE